MEMKKSCTYEERRNIKRKALDKLDLLIEAELNRLYKISPNKLNLDNFEICIDGDYFSDLELEEISSNIAILKKLSAKDEKEREKAKNWLDIAFLCRPIICPWEN